MVEAKHSEVLKNTQATLSCVVSDLTEQLYTVVWEKPNGAGVVTNNEDGYLIEVGTYDSTTKSQTTVLTIPADNNTADSVYTCVVSPSEHEKIAYKSDVSSNVYSKLRIASTVETLSSKIVINHLRKKRTIFWEGSRILLDEICDPSPKIPYSIIQGKLSSYE